MRQVLPDDVLNCRSCSNLPAMHLFTENRDALQGGIPLDQALERHQPCGDLVPELQPVEKCEDRTPTRPQARFGVDQTDREALEARAATAAQTCAFDRPQILLHTHVRRYPAIEDVARENALESPPEVLVGFDVARQALDEDGVGDLCPEVVGLSRTGVAALRKLDVILATAPDKSVPLSVHQEHEGQSKHVHRPNGEPQLQEVVLSTFDLSVGDGVAHEVRTGGCGTAAVHRHENHGEHGAHQTEPQPQTGKIDKRFCIQAEVCVFACK
mmetsp:Transcript_20517/g.71000  ORF Transcript_20517/g.71000 Transcript_20517/m.71000 type:complete len:270 (-) Transcript_20517:335-1144(-)